MKHWILGAVVLSALSVAACQTTTAEMEGETGVKPTTPPEYMPCSRVSESLAYADAVVRTLHSADKSSEAVYWRDRQHRLVNRAYECSR